jgi:photosystem II stability/assembly factor-like uncharacterized protein
MHHPQKRLAVVLNLVLVAICSPASHLGKSVNGRTPALGNEAASSRVGSVETGPSLQSAGDALTGLSLSFEENRGQTDSRARFVTRSGGRSVFFCKDDVVFGFRSPRAARPLAPNTEPLLESARPNGVEAEAISPESARVSLKLRGANRQPRIEGLGPITKKTHYFTGNDPKKWLTNVPQYERVVYRNVYPGVELVFYGSGRDLEYDFILKPGARPDSIRMLFNGVERIRLDASGDLILTTSAGELCQRRPQTYQGSGKSRTEIPSRYVLLASKEVGIAVGSYDRRRTLVIDPVLLYSTFLGGSQFDTINGVAADSSGNAWVTGSTQSFDFPTTGGPLARGGDAFVARLNATGTALLFSAYLAGSSQDDASKIAIDPQGNAYIVGTTFSPNFPTMGAIQPLRGPSDAFITKLSPSGALIYSTFLGGTVTEAGNGIAVTASGIAVVTGSTQSSNFPLVNPAQPVFGGGPASDAFVARLAANGGSLLYSTYLGGNAGDFGNSIAIDAAGNLYIAGQTNSLNFPAVNAFHPEFKGSSIYKSMDASVNWLETRNGLPPSAQVNSIVFDPSNAATVFAGTTRGVFKSLDGGENWTASSTNLTNAIAIDPQKPTTIYAGGIPGMLKSIDGGSTWAILPALPATVNAIVIDPLQPSRVFAGTSSGLWLSINGGATWDRLASLVISSSVRRLAIDPNTPSTMFASLSSGIIRSTDSGGSWSELATPSGLQSFGAIVTAATSPTTVCAAGPAFYGAITSTDGGDTWTQSTVGWNGLTATSLAFDPQTPTTVYAGGFGGVRKSVDSGQTWDTMNAGLVNLSVLAVAVDPSTASSVVAGCQASSDGFVAKIAPGGPTFFYSTYLGGSGSDRTTGIAVDAANNAYVTGFTSSPDYPTLNPIPIPATTPGHAFVTKFNPGGNTLGYSTLIGGSVGEIGFAIAVDGSGSVVLSGVTTSPDFPVVGAISSYSGGQDAFVTRLSPLGSAIAFSRYLGGAPGPTAIGSDAATSVALDNTGSIYVVGNTTSRDFPITPGAFRTTMSDFSDGFAVKIVEFDTCIQNDSGRPVLLLNSSTGAYQFTNCAGANMSGTGAITRRGCQLSFQDVRDDRRIVAQIDGCFKRATATIQLLSQGLFFNIMDRNTANNSCGCAP